MKFREIEKILKQNGWELIDIKGSHYQYKHPTVTIPNHNKAIKPLTLKSILKQAGLK